MKKTIITSMALVSLSAGVFLYSCKKEVAIQPQNPTNALNSALNGNREIQPGNEFNVSVTNNRLVFATIADYQRVVDEPTEATIQSFLYCINQLSFTSLQEQYPTQSDTASTKIYDDYFRAILNPDRVVQIGTYIFRINATQEKVFMLPSAYTGQYASLLAEDISNTNIKLYSTAEDVLDIIQNPDVTLRCKESGIGSYGPATTFWIDNEKTLKVDGTVRFRRYGVYFHLFAEVKGTSGVKVSIDLEPVYYHVRCKNTVGPYKVNAYGGTTNYHKYSSYQGSKSLNKVYFRGKFTGKVTVNGTIYTKYSDWIQIRVNY